MSRKVKIVTPDNVEIEYSLASVGIRAAAAGVDLLIHLAILVVAGIIAAGILLFAEATMDTIYTTIGFFLLIYGVLNYAYFILCDVFMKGQTIGKKVYHIRIIRDNGEGITIAHAMIREFFRISIDPVGVGFTTMFFNKRNKRVGDMLASTIVVEEERQSLSYLELVEESVSKYALTKDEISLIRDYFARKEGLEPSAKMHLEQQLVQYFKNNYDFQMIQLEDEQFLKSLLQ